MSMLDNLNAYDIASNITINVSEHMQGHIIGLGALICNGYSYMPLIGHICYLCSAKELDGICNGVFKLVYVEDYREPDFGFINHVASPERMICDFLMYPEELDKDLWLLDAIEGYHEEFGNFDKVYEMLNHFGISHNEFNEYVEEANI